MSEMTLSVWFVCRLYRGSFGQVDAFIEHKKEKHFTQFQNTNSIVFEERELGLQYPVITHGDHQLADASNEPRIKIEVKDEDPIIPFSSEIINEPNLCAFELMSELIPYESEINPDNENNFFELNQPQQNPYVLLERLTSEEIQSACVPQHHFTYEHNTLAIGSEPSKSLDANSCITIRNKVEKCAEIQPTTAVGLFPTERDSEFECKLCSKQLESDAQLKIHVGVCALYHEDRNRFCVVCNRKLFDRKNLKHHRLRFHGTEEEKLSLLKFECNVCLKKFRKAINLRFHLKSHKETKEQVEISKLKPFKCSHANCRKEFRYNSDLQSHISTVHLRLRPFSWDFPNCNKTFSLRSTLNVHLRIHTGERLFKCTVEKCNKNFTLSSSRLSHYRAVHLIFF